MLTIRSFRNTDLDAICSVWNEHFADQGPSCELTPLRLELFTLAKPYFDEQRFLIAEVDGAAVAFLHYGPIGSSDSADLSTDQLAIYSLCCRRDTSDEVPAVLLAEFEDAAKNVSTEATYRPPLPACGFNLCLGPADAIISTTAEEIRLSNWLAAAGFTPTGPTSLWELDLAFFSPPIDRMQIQIRRSCNVNHLIDEPNMPWWQACVLGHAEPTLFQLVNRAEKSVLCEVLFWTISPELVSQQDPSDAQVAWLWPLEATEEPQQNDQLTFLISEAVRHLQTDQIAQIRTATAVEEHASTEILHKLGFAPVRNGMTFTKQF